MAKLRKKNKLNLNPNEMAFRRIYWPLLQQEKIFTVFRPDSRMCGEYRGYCVGQKVRARIIDKVGADWAGISPKFSGKFFKNIIIKKIEIKKIKHLMKGDFKGSTPDIYDKNSLIYHLGVVYNFLPEEINLESIVTKISFAYPGIIK